MRRHMQTAAIRSSVWLGPCGIGSDGKIAMVYAGTVRSWFWMESTDS